MGQNNTYEQKIAEEGLFWGRFESEANKHGIPWWCDLRRATKLSKDVCGWMSDPVIESILRGARKRRLIQLCLSAQGKVLDIGCGAGWLSLEIARHGKHVDAVEVSGKRLEIARQYLKENPYTQTFGGVQYIESDLNTIRLPEQAYQSVVCWDSLHHIPQIKRLVKEVSRALVPGGLFLVYDHIGPEKNNMRLLKLFRAPFLLFGRMRDLCKKKRGDMPAESHQAGQPGLSPFEDVTGQEMVAVIREHFDLLSVRTELCFLAGLSNDMYGLPGPILYPLLRFLKMIDTFLIATRMVRGEYIFIVARRKNH